MFTNVNNVDCGVFTACVLKPSGCGAGSYSGRAAIGASPNFALSITQNVDAGYTETLCVECQNSAGSIVQHDGWVITQTRNCATALAGAVQGTPLVDQTIAYLNDASLVTKAAGFASFFTNPFESFCGAITTCSLKVSGCGSDYAGSNLAITANTGAITGKQNIAAGYEDTVCIRCENTHGSYVEYDTWKVTQAPDCSTLVAGSLTDQVFDYDAGATATTVYTGATLFTNIRSAACPITSCTLQQTGCSAALVAPFDSLITFVNTSPFTLKISQTQAVGYPNVAVCVSCTNSAHTVTNEVTIR